jgi:hypothetical protein
MLMLIEVEILLHSLIILMLLFFVITLRKSIIKVFTLIRLVVIKEDIGLRIMFRNNNRMLSQVITLERQYQLWHSDILTISAAISVI